MPTVGLSMMVKNAEKDLPHCLRSVQGVVDEIVVVDTGSTDRTREVAAECGAKVHSIAWENHFAQARNAGIGFMTTDWVLVLDPDEELSSEAAARLRPLLVCEEEVAGYQFLQRNYRKFDGSAIGCQTIHAWTGGLERARGANFYIDNPSCRLFRRSPEIFYRRRIHELLEPQIHALGMRVQPTDLVVHHFGFLAESGSREEKDRQYLEITRRAIDEEPGDPWIRLQYGIMQEKLLKDQDAALRSYRRAGELLPGNHDAWMCLANLHLQRQEFESAMEAIAHLPDSGGPGILRRLTTGDALHGAGRLEEARRAYASAAELARAHGQADGARLDLLLESRLGYTEVRLGATESGLERLRKAVDADAQIGENQDRLVKALVLLQRNAEAAEAAEAAIRWSQTEAAYCRAAALRMRAGGSEPARRVVEDGLKVFPESARLQAMRAAIP